MYSITYENLPYTFNEVMTITVDVNNVTFNIRASKEKMLRHVRR